MGTTKSSSKHTNGRSSSKKSSSSSLKKKNGKPTTQKVEKKSSSLTPTKKFDPFLIAKLSYQFMDLYWRQDYSKCIDLITTSQALVSSSTSMQDQGPIYNMALSPDGKFLATFCQLGHVKLWDLSNFQLLATIRDRDEVDIDEFYTGAFSPDQNFIVVGGKRKDRKFWSEDDDDNRILPCTLKVFDLLTGKVINRLEAHSEEVLYIKHVYFRGQSYYVSSGQDGSLWKWKLSSDHSKIESKSKIDDGNTNMSFNISFLPNVGNKYFMSASDDSLKLYDFDQEKIVQVFSTPYSSYCDNCKFISPHKDIKEALKKLGSWGNSSPDNEHAYLITRGVESIDDEGQIIPDHFNTVNLHRLLYPTKLGLPFELVLIQQYTHPKLYSNSWCMNITSNGRYVIAPTTDGTLFAFCLISGQVASTFKQHQDIEIRDVVFHPSRKLMFSCGEDGKVTVYSQER